MCTVVTSYHIKAFLLKSNSNSNDDGKITQGVKFQLCMRDAPESKEQKILVIDFIHA